MTAVNEPWRGTASPLTLTREQKYILFGEEAVVGNGYRFILVFVCFWPSWEISS